MGRLLRFAGRWFKKGLAAFLLAYKFVALTAFTVVVIAVLIEVACRFGVAVYHDLGASKSVVSRPATKQVKPASTAKRAKKPAAPLNTAAPPAAAAPAKPSPTPARPRPVARPKGPPPVTSRAELIRRFGLGAYVQESRRVARDLYHFKPYVMWQHRPFAGRAINITADGTRRTWYNSTDAKAKKVFVFGGSTVWGAYANDRDTFPSQLALLLNKKVGSFKVMNFGQNAFGSTQALILLMLEIRRGNVPDVVIFLSGVNDSFIATCYPAVPGSIYPLFGFYERLSAGAPWREVLRDVYKNSDAIQLLVRAGVLRKVLFQEYRPRLGLYNLKLRDKVRLAARMYRRNVLMAEALAQKFNFKVFFFWQPALYLGNKPLAPFERYLVQVERTKNDYAFLAFKHVPLVYREIRRRPPASKNFFNLSGMFRNHRGLVFGDYVHLLAPGNRLLAAKVVEIIGPRLRATGGKTKP
ncbi:MAG: SGNH/GDSL hydrolase family protein [Proteobacteria bacterium]|nr:SGNH/GDSL hydrolase family protein [Pseudomonadota bacterium]